MGRTQALKMKEFRLILLLSLGLINTTTVVALPSRTSLENEEVKLHCDTAGTSLFTWWIADPTVAGNRIVVFDPTTGGYGYYGHLAGRQVIMDSVTGTLTILSVQLVDELTYYCSRGHLPAAVSLIVLVFPKMPSLQPQLPADFVPVGTHVASTCVLARVKPPASSFNWRINGDIFTEQGNIWSEDNDDGTMRHTRHFQMTLEKEDHNKALSCTAVINGTKISSGQIIMKVGYSPIGTPAISFSLKAGRVGYDVSLICDTTQMALGSTPMHWYIWRGHDDDSILQNTTAPKYMFKANNIDNAGNFTCQVINSFGESEESPVTQVYVQGELPEQKNNFIPIIVGVVLSLVGIILMICAVIVLRKKKKVPTATLR